MREIRIFSKYGPIDIRIRWFTQQRKICPLISSLLVHHFFSFKEFAGFLEIGNIHPYPSGQLLLRGSSGPLLYRRASVPHYSRASGGKIIEGLYKSNSSCLKCEMAV
jgi:hypothetical protein